MAVTRISTTSALTLVALATAVACSSAGGGGESAASRTQAVSENPCQTSWALQRAALGMGEDEGGSSSTCVPGRGKKNGNDCGDSASAVAKGRHAFSDRTIGTNGRACADCHSFADEFKLRPASAKARYDALQACRAIDPTADDPLFRPIDADDFRVNGNNASSYKLLTEEGLIRITLPLPSNVVLIDPATNLPKPDRTVDVWRAPPSIYNVAITGPDGLEPTSHRVGDFGRNDMGGYLRDARAATLQEQAAGALNDHMGLANPPQDLLDNLAAFEKTLFSNERVAALAAALANGTTPLPSTDGPLTALEEQGRTIFNRTCAQCHGNSDFAFGAQQQGSHPTGSTTHFECFPGLRSPECLRRYHGIDSICPRPTGANETFKPCSATMETTIKIYEVTAANGTKTRVRTSDGGRGLLQDPLPTPGDLRRFDVPSLFNISKAGPWFHNHQAKTLDEVLDHYAAEYNHDASGVNGGNARAPYLTTNGIDNDRPFTAAERPALLAYLNTL